MSFIAKHIGKETHVESLNIHFKDEPSGDFIFNLGMVEIDEEKGKLVINIRYPVTLKGEEIIKKLESELAKIDEGLYLSDASDNPPLYVPADSLLVKKLQKVYKEVTGEEPELIAIGEAPMPGPSPILWPSGPSSPVSRSLPMKRMSKSKSMTSSNAPRFTPTP